MNWRTVIRHYNSHHRPNEQGELNWFRRQSSLEDAISVAAKAENECGLRYSHQCRITRKALQDANSLVLERHDELQESKSFHDVWLIVKGTLEVVAGIGDLYIYDTALRIGAKLNLLPERIYLHAGTRRGARAFGLVTQQKEWLEPNELPKALRDLPAHEVEDILCIYRNKTLSHKGCA